MRSGDAILKTLAITALLFVNAFLIHCLMSPHLDPDISPAPTTSAGTSLSPAKFNKEPFSKYSLIVQRPIFDPGRRPFVPPPPAPPPRVAQAPPPPRPLPAVPSVVAGGVVLDAAQRKVFLAQRDDRSRGSWVGEGETIAGWRVRAIGENGAELELNGHIHELKLYER